MGGDEELDFSRSGDDDGRPIAFPQLGIGSDAPFDAIGCGRAAVAIVCNCSFVDELERLFGGVSNQCPPQALVWRLACVSKLREGPPPLSSQSRGDRMVGSRASWVDTLTGGLPLQESHLSGLLSRVAAIIQCGASARPTPALPACPAPHQRRPIQANDPPNEWPRARGLVVVATGCCGRPRTASDRPRSILCPRRRRMRAASPPPAIPIDAPTRAPRDQSDPTPPHTHNNTGGSSFPPCESSPRQPTRTKFRARQPSRPS